MNLKEFENFNFFKLKSFKEKNDKKFRFLNWTTNIIIVASLIGIYHYFPKFLTSTEMSIELTSDSSIKFFDSLTYVQQGYNEQNLQNKVRLLFDTYILSEDLNNIEYLYPVIEKIAHDSSLSIDSRLGAMFSFQLYLDSLSKQSIESRLHCNVQEKRCLFLEEDMENKISFVKKVYLPLISNLITELKNSSKEIK